LRYVPLREDLHAQQYLDHPENQMTPIIEKIPAGAVMVMDANAQNDVGM